LGLLYRAFGALRLFRARHLRELRGGLRRAGALRLLDHRPLLLPRSSDEIGQNSCGSGSRFRRDRRCGVLAGLNRLRVSEPTEEPFGLSPCLALHGRVREVLVDIAFGDIVRRDQIDPIILAGGG
jgi:hypothetical protein